MLCAIGIQMNWGGEGEMGWGEALIEDAPPRWMHLCMPTRMQSSNPLPTICLSRRLLVAFLFDIEEWVGGSKSS